MDYEQMIAQVRSAMAARLAERAAQVSIHSDIRSLCESEGRAPTAEEESRASAARAEVARIDTELETQRARITELEDEQRRDAAADALQRSLTGTGVTLPGQDGNIRMGQEPRTYTRDSGSSFFADAWNAQRGNVAARDRLERHATEVIRHGEMSERALATGGIAGLAVPQYLVDLAAPVLRNGRPLANICNRHQLPASGMSLVIPRGTTGASTAVQATENSAVSSTDEVWANLTVPVATVAGQQDVSRQTLERGEGMDEVIYLDLVRAYAANVDTQVISGTGASGQVLGILNTAGIGAATAFGAAATVTNFSLKVSGAIVNVTTAGAGLYPKALVMHPRRWGWLTGQVDSSGRPVVQANSIANFNAVGQITQPGQISADGGAQFIGVHSSGLPVLTDLNIPTNVGTNSEDVVLALDTTEQHLWEDGDGMPRQLSFEQTTGGSLTTKLVVYGYIAFSAGRYPGATAKVGGLDATAGNGLIAPTF